MGAGAIGSLVEGYCDEFVKLAASLAQTLEQASMRGVSLDAHQRALHRTERGMRALADAIGVLLQDKAAAMPDGRRSVATGIAPASAAVAPASRAGSCILNGTTDSLPIASVFQFLGRMRKTGELRVTIGAETLAFAIENGEVEQATSSRPPSGETLADLLVELRILRRHQIDDDEEPDETLAERLLRLGTLSEEKLAEARYAQLQRRCRRASTAKPAAYSFHEQARTTGDGRVRARAADLRLASPR